jgi:hypothetical protein
MKRVAALLDVGVKNTWGKMQYKGMNVEVRHSFEHSSQWSTKDTRTVIELGTAERRAEGSVPRGFFNWTTAHDAALAEALGQPFEPRDDFRQMDSPTRIKLKGGFLLAVKDMDSAEVARIAQQAFDLVAAGKGGEMTQQQRDVYELAYTLAHEAGHTLGAGDYYRKTRTGIKRYPPYGLMALGAPKIPQEMVDRLGTHLEKKHGVSPPQPTPEKDDDKTDRDSR